MTKHDYIANIKAIQFTGEKSIYEIIKQFPQLGIIYKLEYDKCAQETIQELSIQHTYQAPLNLKPSQWLIQLNQITFTSSEDETFQETYTKEKHK